MMNRRRNAGVAAVNGMIYVVGGDDGTTNLNTVEFYNPQTDTWQWLESTMEVERRSGGHLFQLNKLFSAMPAWQSLTILKFSSILASDRIEA